MEISPIPGIRTMPSFKAQRMDSELSAVIDIDNCAKIGDETYTPSGGKSAGGGEDEFDDFEEENDEDELKAKSAGNADRQISFFA